ncbi:hypothetical protein DMC01_01510 [Campylobacter troglodytis]|nr:hypothetical protein DMC01_01510 [Campylobacter troglodytis]
MTIIFLSLQAKPKIHEFMKKHLEFNGFFASRLRITNQHFFDKELKFKMNLISQQSQNKDKKYTILPFFKKNLLK